MYKLEPTKQFAKNLRKLSSDDQRLVAKKLKLLVQNPFHPSLRTKKVQSLDDVFECSVNMSVRVLWKYKGSTLILLIDIGRHDILP